MKHHWRRDRFRLISCATTLGLIALSGGAAYGDVVLHPGTVSGTIGLSGIGGFQSAGVYISNGSFSASTSFSGNSFTLTTEGNQTYNTVDWNQWGYSPNYQSFNFSSYDVSLTVPEGGVATVDFSRPGGTIVLDVDVSTITTTDPTTGLPVTTPQGSVAYAWFNASAINGSESYGGYAQASSGECSMPMAASSSVNVSGQATINVFDASGLNVLCTVDVSFPTQTVALDAGQTVTVENLAQVDPSMCAAAVLRGSVGLHNTPGGLFPSFAYVYAGGPSSFPQYLTGFSAAAPDQTYEFDGLQKTLYYPSVSLDFPAPYSGDYLYLPNQDPNHVDLSAGGTVERDFVFDGAIGAGNVALGGPAARFASYGQQSFSGVWGYPQPSPSAGGFASSSIDLTTGNFNVVLTPGTWQENANYFGFSESVQGVQYNDYLYLTQQASITVAGGQTVALPQQSVSVSESAIVFDVIEPPGSPVIGITNPWVSAYRNDPATNSYTSVTAYAWVTNVDTPAVRLIAPPGDYSFDAYATVQGTYVRFASSTISVGTAVDTPSGTNVVVVPADPSGNPTPVTLDFGSVTQGGQTTASFTDVGPGAPPDYSLLDVISNARYLNITTNAQFTQTEVCIHYDPTTLGVAPAQESTLELQEFLCSSTSSCSWQVVNGVFPGDNGGSAVNTSTHTICGLVDQLGTFGITLPNVVLVPPTDTCVGATGAPAQLGTDPNACTTSIDNDNQLAGGCSGGGGGGLASCTFDGAATETLSPGSHTVAIVGTADDGSTTTCSSYVDIVDRQAPGISCSPPATVECIGTRTPVSVTSSCSDNCGACTTSCGNGSFPLGDTTIACNAVDPAGNKSSCSTKVHIQDTTPPAISASALPRVLWPPNHKLVGINLTKTATDTCDPNPSVTCTATSNEPDNGLGDGDTPNDIQWVNGGLLLRAERSGTGTGRVYTITCTATDASGNRSSASTTVAVPLSQ
jgi:hypothetical protein